MRTRSLVTTVAVLSAAAVVGARLRAGLPTTRPDADLPLAVTVVWSEDELTERAATLPPEQAALLAACHRSPAPGGRGTELRLTSGHPESRQELRLLKQVLETGHPLPPDDTSGRPRTPGGRLLDLAIASSGRRGRL